MSSADDPSECANLRDDYFECLHHRKEIQRNNSVEEQRAKLINEKAEKLKAEIWKDVFDDAKAGPRSSPRRRRTTPRRKNSDRVALCH